MKISLEGLVVIVGNYGSGKTEVSINLAVERRRAGMAVRVADLDLVNPYFRTREARGALAELGIEVVLPPEMYLNADLPVLSPVVSGMIRQSGPLTILDVGGDDVGATVLSSLCEPLRGRNVRMLQVVNPMRPFTETLEGCRVMRERIESASRLTINGIIGNANLMEDTLPEHIYRGYEFTRELADQTGLALEFVTVPAELASAIDAEAFACPLLPIHRQLVPPWKKAARLAL